MSFNRPAVHLASRKHSGPKGKVSLPEDGSILAFFRNAMALAAICCGVGVAKGDPALADGASWRAEEVVTALAAREESIEEIDAVIERTQKLGPDWKRYSLARKASNDAMARFYGQQPKPSAPLHETTTQLPEPTFFRYRADTAGHLRIDYLEGLEDPDTFSIALCFDGQVWQTFRPKGPDGPHVTIDSPATLAQYNPVDVGLPIGPALGIAGPLWAFGECPDPQRPTERRTTSEYLSDAVRAGSVYGPKAVTDPDGRRLIRLRIVHSMEQKHPGARKPLYLQVNVLLDPAYGFAPAKVDIAWVFREGNGYRDTGDGPSWAGAWNDYLEVAPGAWVAKSFGLNKYVSLVQPSGRDFQPLLKDGKRVLKNGYPEIDLSVAKSVKYCFSQEFFRVHSIQVNHGLDRPLCKPAYPADTIVLDRRANEVFQLTGISPAVDAKLKRVLQSGGASTAGDIPTSRGWWGHVIGIGLLASGLIGAYCLYRYRKA